MSGKNHKPLVKFLIAGAQKAGTTALWSYLRRHPDLFMPRKKELHFFDSEHLFKSVPQRYEAYHWHFRRAKKQGQLCGEATPIYMYWQSAAERIWRYNPSMKLILILRNPIKRAYSHWNMERSRRREKFSFLDAILTEESRCLRAFPLQHRKWSYVDRGRYSRQIERLYRYFPLEQILVLRSEDLLKDHQAVLSKICQFLMVRDISDVQNRIAHQRTYVQPMSQHEWTKLLNIMDQEFLDLEDLLGWDCCHWRRSPLELLPQTIGDASKLPRPERPD